MGQANGFALVLSSQREAVFRQCLTEDELFAEPVPDFLHSRNAPLLCFVLSGDATITHLGAGSRGMRAGTGIRRLNVRNSVPLSTPVAVSAILDAIPSRLRST